MVMADPFFWDPVMSYWINHHVLRGCSCNMLQNSKWILLIIVMMFSLFYKYITYMYIYIYIHIDIYIYIYISQHISSASNPMDPSSGYAHCQRSLPGRGAISMAEGSTPVEAAKLVRNMSLAQSRFAVGAPKFDSNFGCQIRHDTTTCILHILEIVRIFTY